MSRAKAPLRPPAGPSLPRPPSRGGRSGSTRPSWVSEYLLQWHNLGLVALGISILILPWGSLVHLLGQVRDSIIRALGYGIFLVVAAAFVIGGLLLLGRFRFSRHGLRLASGLLCFAIGVWGVLGFFRPSGTLAGASLTNVSAGGQLGAALSGSPIGLLIWLAACVGGCAIFWPRGTWGALRSVPPLLAALWCLRLDRRLWHMLVACARLFTPQEDVAVEPFARAATPEPVAAEVAEEEPEPVAVPRATGLPAARPPEPAPAPRAQATPWQLPPAAVLNPPVESAVSASDNAARSRLIVETLASFGVDARVVQVNQGPTVTQFGLEPGWEVKTRTVPEKDPRGKAVLDKDGNPRFRTEEVSRTRVRVNQITTLANDLALALAAPSIRIEAPVPGKPVVGIEVPNTSASVVSMRSVIESGQFQKLSQRSKLALALGKGVSGEPVAADLARMPHLLIAGATGAGKSVCINSLIACILAHATPDEVRFIMIDPKRVELSAFGQIPHLALSKVIVDVEEVVGTLGAVIREMEARYKKFEQLGVRNLEAYNRHAKVARPLPFWVVIIDELADLMMAVPFEVERQICRLAQLARATGIHLVVATQRPSVDVVTGLIKANFPTRIAFAVSSQVDSRTILDSVGAEKLLGRGDMLFLATDAPKPRRLQGVYVSDQEIERLVDFWTSERWEPYRPPVYDHLVDEAKAEQEKDEQSDDPLLERATELAHEHSRVSVSMLQRRLRIGYPRAARLMDQLEEAGIVGPAEGGQSREVIAEDDGGFGDL
jgi:DNA segregation ATPase FtsK/SpoIIIE-like protein